MPPNASSRNTRRAPIVRFTILGRLTAARTPPAPNEDMRSPSLPAAQPLPPTAPTVAATTIPSPENAKHGPSHHRGKSPHLNPMTTQPLPSTVRKMWKSTGMANQHPLLPRPLGPTLSTKPPRALLGLLMSLLVQIAPLPRAPLSPREPLPTRGLSPTLNKHAPRRKHDQGQARVTNLTLVQHNSLGSWNVFLSVFNFFVEFSPVDIVLLQDPPVYLGSLQSFAGFNTFAPPVPKPRVACYVALGCCRKYSLLPAFIPQTDDVMFLDIFTP